MNEHRLTEPVLTPIVILERNVMAKIDVESLRLVSKIDAAVLKLDGRMNTLDLMLGTMIALSIAILLKLT